MHTVLSIDLSCDPARAELVEVQDRTIKVLEAHSAPLPALLEYVFAPPSSGLTESEIPQPPTAAPETTPGPAPAAAPGAQVLPKPAEQLKALLANFKSVWASSVVTIPTPEYLSLNVDLPFDDAKQIGKVLPLEVQDRIPFDIHEFLIEHRNLGEYTAHGQKSAKDIHVSLLPRRYLARLLEVCKIVDLEPRIVSSPATFIAGALHLAPDYFAPDSALVYAADDGLYVNILRDGAPRCDRALCLPWAAAAGENEQPRERSEHALKGLLIDLKLTLSAFESRYQRPLSKVYFFGAPFSRDELQQAVTRSVETITVSELTRQGSSEGSSYSGVATLAALFVQEGEAPTPLVNFRTQEFAYSPRIKELVRGLRDLAPYFLFVALLGMLTLAAVFYTRARYVNGLRSAIAGKIRATLGPGEYIEGAEPESLKSQIKRLETQLADLGSLSRYSPLEAFVEASKDFPTLPGVTLRAVTIRDDRIKVEGVVPDYGIAGKIAREFTRKPQTYKRAKEEVASATAPGGGRPFTLDIILAE